MALEIKLSLYTIWIILNIYCLWIDVVNARILVYQSIINQLIEEYNDMPAQFGGAIPSNGLKVFAIPTQSKFGCDKILPPPTDYPHNAKFALIIKRGGEDCTFEKKVRNAQAAFYHAAIIYNNEGDDLEHMSAKNATGIIIPSLFVGLTTGESLKSFNTQEIVLVINDELPFNINTQLILPFSILIGLCFLVMILYMIYKCIREERRLRRYRLPKRLLKKLPIIRYTAKNKDLVYDTCVICLDDFVEGDKLRVLPCKHPYHSDCIDTWLTQNKRDCPICKRKVFTKGAITEHQRDQQLFDGVTDTDDDTTPLLQQTNRRVTAAILPAGSTRHGTFSRGDSAGRGGGGAEDGGLVTNDSRTLNGQNDVTTDDEMMTTSVRRINPFDRVPNLPPHLAAQLNTGVERRSIWSWSIFRIFRRTPDLSIAAPPYHEDILNDDMSDQSGAYINVDDASLTTPIRTEPQQSSNNILNPNLSGSFKSVYTTENVDDDEPPMMCIYEPSNIAGSSTAYISLQPQTRINNSTETDSVFIQTPTHGGLGVAALPSNDNYSVQQNRPRDIYQNYV